MDENNKNRNKNKYNGTMIFYGAAQIATGDIGMRRKTTTTRCNVICIETKPAESNRLAFL
jgi:hypothetical protein